MAQESLIEWTCATFNGWLGCTEVGGFASFATSPPPSRHAGRFFQVGPANPGL